MFIRGHGGVIDPVGIPDGYFEDLSAHDKMVYKRLWKSLNLPTGFVDRVEELGGRTDFDVSDNLYFLLCPEARFEGDVAAQRLRMGFSSETRFSGDFKTPMCSLEFETKTNIFTHDHPNVVGFLKDAVNYVSFVRGNGRCYIPKKYAMRKFVQKRTDWVFGEHITLIDNKGGEVFFNTKTMRYEV